MHALLTIGAYAHRQAIQLIGFLQASAAARTGAGLGRDGKGLKRAIAPFLHASQQYNIRANNLFDLGQKVMD